MASPLSRFHRSAAWSVSSLLVLAACSITDEEAFGPRPTANGGRIDGDASTHGGPGGPGGAGGTGASGPGANGPDGAANQPPVGPATPANAGAYCRSASSLDIFDANGVLDPARYQAVAAAFHTEAAVGFRFGHDATHYHATPESFPTAHLPGDHDFSHGTNQPISTWQIGGPFESDPGGYNTSAGQVMYIPDDANAPGIDAVQFIEVANAVVSQKPQLSWTAYGGGSPDQSTSKAAMLSAHGGAFKNPIAIARAVTTDQWTQDAVAVFQDGSLLTTGTHASGGNSNVYARLPTGLVPTAIALTTNSEFALVTVWDPATVRGGLAVVSLGGPASSGWWGDWNQVYPSFHSYALFSFMKVLGVVWINGMAAPTAVAASTDTRWPMIGAPTPSTLDLSDEGTRSRFKVGGDLDTRYSASGFALVMSRAEKKVAFVDLQPLFESVNAAYFGTRAAFDHTRNFGQAPTQFPETFDVAPASAPVVVKVHDVDACPSAVATTINVFAPHNFVDPNDDRHARIPASFTAHALVGTEEGTVRVFDVGGLRDDSAASAAAIKEVSRVTVGRNPTSIVPLGRTSGSFGNPVDYAVVSRGDRRVELWKGNPQSSALTLWKTIADSRLVDPITVEDVTWFGNYVPLVEVADFGGKQVVAYRYEQAKLDFYGGRTIGLGPTGNDAFECGGVYPTAGRPLFVSSTNVP